MNEEQAEQELIEVKGRHPYRLVGTKHKQEEQEHNNCKNHEVVADMLAVVVKGVVLVFRNDDNVSGISGELS